MLKGRVFVIQKRLWKTEDLIGFEDGMILVVKNTTPNISIIVDRLQIIITEIESPLCHAAIIAREYRKPILMGQKEITKQLNTGDEIVVDLENKIITKC